MPTAAVAENTRHENVIIADGVVLSSTQLSESIDKLDGDSQRRRPTFTSVSTFPCCQVRFKAHENSTFPLFFENNQLVDHLENISLHDLLKHIMERIKDEENINNKTLILMRNEFGRDQWWIKGNQWVTPLRHNFPVTLKQSKSHSFPCSSFDFQHNRLGLENPLPVDVHSFPLTLKCEIFKFPFSPEKAKDCLYYDNTNLKKMLHLMKTNSNKVQAIFKKTGACVLQRNRQDLLHIIKNQGEYDNIAAQFERSIFPLKTQTKQGSDNKFPFLVLRQNDFSMASMEIKSSIKPINIKRSAHVESGDEIDNFITTLISQSSAKSKTEPLKQNTTTFPIKAKGINSKFPLQDKVQAPTHCSKQLQLKLISKSLQDIIPKSYINILNKPKSKFPLETKSKQKPIKQFPLNSLESEFEPCLILNQTKTKSFPVTSQVNKSKFPHKNTKMEIILNLTVKETRQKFYSNKVNETLKLTQFFNAANYHKPQVNLATNMKFPLKYHKTNLDVGNQRRSHLKENTQNFPLNQISSTNTNFHKPETKLFSLNTNVSQCQLAEVMAFPLKTPQNFDKFPVQHYPRELILILSTNDVKEKFQSNKVLKSLQPTHNLYDIVNSKSFTKFPLEERLVKKFRRKFPSVKDIAMPHGAIALRKEKKISIGQQQQYFTNFSNDNATSRNNVNIFKIITTAEAAPSMTSDLYKQHWPFCQQRNTTVADNEKHASQVQFTQQVHVENPVGTPPTTPRPSQTQETPPTHNVDDKDVNILPAIDAKNISLTTTKTATEVGQYSENFEHHDAIINIRAEHDDDDADDASSLSSGATLSKKIIINSSFNHRKYNEDKHECERERNVGGILRASTPPMSAITSVQNTERLVVLHDHDNGGDLCNPQVAQIVECSSDVRDTFNTTVDNGGSTKLNLSITGNILDQNQNESSPPPPQIPEPPLLTSSPSPSRIPTLNVAAVASISDRICSTSLAENYTNSSDILPKYSVLELSESNAINCPEIDCTQITGVIDQSSRQSSEKERTAAVSYEITNDLVDATNINEIFQSYTNEQRHSLDNSEIEDIYDLEFNLDDLTESDEMKLEMKSSKGALPSTTSATARNIGKASETGASSINRSKPYATPAVSRGPSVHVPSTVPPTSLTRPTTTQRPANYHSSSGITPSSATLRSASDRISSTAPTNSIARPTATRRLSSDYSSVPANPTYSTTPRTISSIPTSPAYQRTSSNLTSPRGSLSFNYGSDSVKALSATPVTNRYTTDDTNAATPSAAPKLKYTRRPTSGTLLSLDLPRYPSSSESLTDTSATIHRGVSLDTNSASGVLPERTRLRRQRRFRPQDSQDEDEDAIERLNRLKARISASLSEVKGVLKQYSTEGEGENENETQTSNALTPSATTCLTLGKVNEDAAAEENEEKGPVTFRFVKKIRRRSFFTEDDDTQLDTGKDEVDKSQSVAHLQKDASPLKLPQAANEISNEFQNQEYKLQSESNNTRSAASKLSPTPVIKLEKEDVQSQDIGPTPRASQKSKMGFVEDKKYMPTGTEKTDNLLPKNNEVENNKRPTMDDDRQDEQLVEIKTNEKKDDLKVDESETGNIKSKVMPEPEIKVHNEVSDKTEKLTKKGQNNKVKANKNGSQQRDMKTGKSASKIPQRTKTKPVNSVNDPKPETKISASATKTQNDDNLNEIKRNEISKQENIKEISAKSSADEIKNTNTDGKHQGTKDVVPILRESTGHHVIPNDISSKEVSPKSLVTDIKMQDNKGKEINATKIIPQIENHLERKENDLKINKEVNTDKKESSPKPAKLAIEVKNERPITTGEIGRTKDVSPKSKASDLKGLHTENKDEKTRSNMENQKDVSPQPTSSMTDPLKPLIKLEGIAIHQPKAIDIKKAEIADSDLGEKETTNEDPVKLRKKLATKTNDPLRRASLAAVEGSKIEPPVKIAAPGKIERRPSDSEAIVKKKLITTKTTTSGSIEEVSPKPKIVKVKRSSIKKPTSPSAANSNDTRHQLATTQAESNSTNNRNGQRIKEAASLSSTEPNKSIQGDKNKDVTMPNDEMLTQMPPQPPANDTKLLVGQINRTQLLINEAATKHTPSSSLTRKTIELDASSSQATIENAKATTTKLAASKFENSDGGAMLANSKPIVVSATTASAVIGPKQAITVAPQEDLYDLLQQEAVIFVKPTKKDPNELKADEGSKEGDPHKNLSANNATPANLEASAKQLNEPLEIPQQQVVNTTDIVVIKSNDDSVQVIATPPQQSSTSIDSANLVSKASSSPVDQHITSSITTNQQTQQQHPPTTTTTTIGDATTKTDDSPQISISTQVATTEDTQSKAATQTTSIQEATLQIVSQGLEGDLLKMPEFQLSPAPVQTAEIPHKSHKINAVVNKVIRHNSGQNNKKSDEKVVPIEESVIPEIELDQLKDETATASSGEDLSEGTELSTEESSSQSEAGAAAIKPKKVRKAKKKVIIKREKRRLSISGDSFFSHNSTDDPVSAEVDTLEKPISFVSDEDEDEEDEPVAEETKPLKSCINKKEFEIGDEIVYGERIKKTQIKWRRGRVKECTSSISYLLDIDGKEVWSHVSNLKKYSSRKVNFGTKEYLEIDYEQLAEDEERAERIKQRTFSIWNMV